MKSWEAMTGIFPDLTSASSTIPRTPPQWSTCVCEIDHGGDRKALASVFLKQLPRRAGRFLAHHRVENDPAGLAADESDVGEIEAADLVDAWYDLVEAAVVIQHRLPVQRGMNGVKFLFLIQELKALHVPGNMAGVRHDLEIFHGSKKPLFLLVEVSRVGERQVSPGLLEHFNCESRLRLAHGMEMPLQGVDLLSMRRAGIQVQMAGYGESCSHRGNRLNEGASGRHLWVPQLILPPGGAWPDGDKRWYALDVTQLGLNPVAVGIPHFQSRSSGRGRAVG